MNIKGKWMILRLLLICFIFTNYSFALDSNIKIAVLAKRGAEVTHKRWDATAKYLSKEIKDYTFEIVPVTLENLVKAVQDKEVSFVLANSGFYVEIEHDYNAQRIATVVNKHGSGLSQKEFGAVILTHIGNKNRYNSLKSIKDASFAAVKKKAFGGWQMAWRELVDVGIDIKSDLKSISFKGTHDKVVYSIINKESDVGTVRTGTLERMAADGKIDLNQLYIINSKDYDSFPFLVSTRLYPEWPMAKLKHTSEELSKKVAIALMKMDVNDQAAINSTISGWNTPLNYQPVHDCFETLEIPPYYNPITFLDVIEKYWIWIVFYSILTVSGISMFLYQLRLTSNLKDTQEELVQTEKMASLGRLVAGVAHEINTPLGVGVTAASHLHKEVDKFKKNYLNDELTKTSFESFIDIASQSSDMILKNLERAAKLVDSFKQISVDQSSDEIRDFNVKEYVESIIESLKPSLKKTTHTIDLRCDESLNIESNPGAISQVLSNLIMNSIIHGLEDMRNGKMIIEIKKIDNDLKIVYKDNGKGMSKQNLVKIFDPFFTTKRASGGSGLGTHIIYNVITQKLNGNITAESTQGDGLKFIIKLKGIKYV